MNHPALICFGEVLWDLLPDGPVAGGAPMNVAFHANQLGLKASMISRVGDDALGRDLLQFLEKKAVPTALIQTDPALPTGTVKVTFSAAGSPSYEIVRPVAWDALQPDPTTAEQVRHATALVYGSLACRTENNKKTLFNYLKRAAVRVCDINLRVPFYDQALLEELIAAATILKLNDEELALLAGWYRVGGDERTQLEYFKNRFDCALIILTRGKDGAACLSPAGFFEHPGFRVQVQDTVGAGDSFLAGFLSQHLRGASVPESLAFAAAVGALVASKKGGTPELALGEIEALLAQTT
ncbi:MAG: carbohydrate kinase [Saprospiraceae bacterium]|nr:carbohydrate kinase [Saprospiraceae bacterium]